MIRRPLTMLGLVLGSCAILLGQGTVPPPAVPPPPGQNPQQPIFRARIDSISVDVTVTDRQGRPVTDLTADDFDIRESGKPQTVDSFRFIQFDETPPIGVEPPKQILSKSEMDRETANPENRLFIIFLDDYHVRAGNALHIRQVMAKFVQTLTAHDLVAIMYPLTDIRAVTFSRDHDSDAMAIMNFQGRKFDYKPLNRYEDAFAYMTPQEQESIRNDITIRTLQSACSLLATLRDGRKTLIYVSEGMGASIPPGALTSSSFGPPRTVAPPSTGAMQSYEFFRSSDLLNRMRDIFAIATRGNTSIYTINARGLAPSEFGAGDAVNPQMDQRYLNETLDSLRVMADETDGRAITTTNDPLPDLKKLVHELSAYYLLGYTSTLAPRDGKFHPIEVRVKRPNVTVKARKGYWAYSEEELRRAAEPPKAGPPEEIASALDALAGVVEPTSRHNVVLWLGAVRGDAERAQVTLVWEASAAGLVTSPEDRVEQVTATISAGSETVFRGAIPRDPAALRASGRVTFAAPAGPIRVRLASENARGQKLDTEDVSDLVPDFSGTGPAITAPLVFRARTARDVAALKAAPTAGMPSATRLFSRTERLFLRFDAYGPAGSRPDISMRVLNRAGPPLATLPVPAATASHTFESELSLANFQQGDYLIEITAATSTDKVVRLLGIRVTG